MSQTRNIFLRPLCRIVFRSAIVLAATLVFAPLTFAQSTSTGLSFPPAPIHFDPHVGSQERSDLAEAPIVAPIGTQLPSPTDSFDGSVEQASFHASDPTGDTAAATSELSGMWDSLSSVVGAKWQESGMSDSFQSVFGDADIGRMFGSLALVLGGYFALVWVLRMFNFGGQGGVPTEVLELLGSVPLAPKKQLQIVRLGSKLLLLVDSEEGTHPIGEISDPDEVEYLASLCPGRKKASRGNASRIRSASRGMAARQATQDAAQTPVSATTAPTLSAPVASPQPTPAPAAGENHLAAILQALNGPRSGNAAVFEG